MVENDDDSSSVPTTFVPSPTNPLFLMSSDVPGVSLVTNPFSGIGFGGWRRNVIVSLSARNKLGFIDGSVPKPPENSPQFRQWDRCNNMVISWLTNSLTPEIAESVQYSDTAQSIWSQLNNRYGSVNGTKLFEVKQQLASTTQGSLDIASYFNKLKKLWDELNFMRSSRGTVSACGVACSGRIEFQKEDDENKVHQFLMGLNETYIGVRSNILMMQPPPSLDSAYNILLQDERQRQVTHSPSQFHTDSSAFSTQFMKKPYGTYSNPKQFNQKIRFDTNKTDLVCRYCKKPGHLIEKCYKLHGFPSDFKFTKDKRTAASVAVQKDMDSAANVDLSNMGEGVQNCSASDSSIPGLTKEQYSQLLILLQQTQASESQHKSSVMGSANFAGPFSE